MLDDGDHQARSGPEAGRDFQQHSAVYRSVLGGPGAQERPPAPVHIREPVHKIDEGFHTPVAERLAHRCWRSASGASTRWSARFGACVLRCPERTIIQPYPVTEQRSGRGQTGDLPKQVKAGREWVQDAVKDDSQHPHDSHQPEQGPQPSSVIGRHRRTTRLNEFENHYCRTEQGYP